MRFLRWTRCASLFACGAMMLQVTGCTFQTFNDVIQTLLLGVTSAGAIAIIRNI